MSTTLPPVLQNKHAQEEGCLCNEDYTICVCCESALFPPFACELVIEGEEVTGPVSVDLNLTTDDLGRVYVRGNLGEGGYSDDKPESADQ